MVASDTVVGLVGAGILLVALVGVFVYESRQGAGGPADLETAEYATQGSGTVTLSAGNNPVPGGPCVPPACTGASTAVDVTLKGLPEPGNLKYVGYLTGGGTPYKVGSFQKSGQDFKLSSNTPVSNTDKSSFVVSLEKGDGAASPSLSLLSFSVRSGSTSVPKEGTANFLGETGEHTLRFTPLGNQVNLTSTINEVPHLTGYTYRAWLEIENDTGKGFVFAGNYTEMMEEGGMHEGGQAHFELTCGGPCNVPGERDDYNEFLVTIEGQDSATPMVGAEGSPGGPAVIVSKFNEFIVSAAPVP